MVVSETIYGMHENQSVKRSGQACGAARVRALNGITMARLPHVLSCNRSYENCYIKRSLLWRYDCGK
ncbi:hypothetical protein F9S79_24015 [Escherichia coli]|nr:hypothetical protein [Escherichia coli]EFA5259105.1 hypothetical protein [Escherichia coli]EFA7535626.1 hypothetical protein [Escherichia coli]EFB1739382.1 hypothetical protein [Escherichia coli]EFB3057760.1 hypothetical protein [Escherichia coli]